MAKKPTYEKLEQRIKELDKEVLNLKRAEDEMKESAVYLDIMGDALMVLDSQARVIKVNKVFSKMWGYTPNEVHGKPIFGLFQKEELPKHKSEMENAVKEGDVRIFETIASTKDKKEINVSVAGTVLKDEKGKLLNFIALFRDITDRKQSEEALRESEERNRQLVKHAPSGIFEVDFINQKFVSVNDLMCEYSGYTREEFLSMGPFDILAEDSQKHFSERLGKLFAGENVPESVEFKARDKKGQEYWIILNSSFVYENGKPVGATVIVHDITDRKQAEEALRESEKRYAKAEQIGHFGHYDRNLLEEKGTWSNETYHIFGVNPDQFQPTWENFLNFVHPSDREFVKSEVETAVSQCKTFDYDYRIIRPDGSERFIHSIAEIGFNESGQPTGLVGTVHDITEQRQAEEELRESEEKYRTLFETSADGILIADIGTKKFRYANHAVCRILGYTEEELTNLGVMDIHPKESLEYVISKFEAQAAGKKSLAGDIPCLRKDGTVVYADFNTVLAIIDGVECNFGIVRDITERKQVEEDLKQASEKLQKEHDQRKSLSKRLIDLLEKDRRQIAMELHDNIGQTLISLKMNLEMIHGKLKPGHTELEAQITAAQERAIQSIKDVKSVSQGLRPSMIDALGLIPSLRELFNMIQQQTDIEIHFFSQRIPKQFEGEKELAIYRIAQEALNNIIRHAQAKNVFVNLIKKNKKLSLSVEDDGVGFDPDKVMKSSERKKSLGLLIMRERAVQLDGEFSIESQPGKGMHLLVEIPL